MVTYSLADLRGFARQARGQYDRPLDNCDRICDTLGNLLCDHGFPYRDNDNMFEVRQFRLGPSGEDCHYIFVLPTEYVEGIADGRELWIDPSLDQFCDENKEAGHVQTSFGPRADIDPVYIYEPGDSRRQRYMTFAEFVDL